MSLHGQVKPFTHWVRVESLLLSQVAYIKDHAPEVFLDEYVPRAFVECVSCLVIDIFIKVSCMNNVKTLLQEDHWFDISRAAFAPSDFAVVC